MIIFNEWFNENILPTIGNLSETDITLLRTACQLTWDAAETQKNDELAKIGNAWNELIRSSID